MTAESTTPGAQARILRLTGTELAPSWRGRLHLWAAAASLPAGVALVVHHPSAAVAGYAIALTALFGVSAMYHVVGFRRSGLMRWRQADHVVIYLFMGAAYVPFCQEVVRGTLGDVLLGLALAGAVAGAAVKLLSFQRSKLVGAVLYMAIGWMAAVALPDAVRTLSPGQVALLGLTGLFYMGGSVVFARRWPDPFPSVFGYHEIWHACVVAASAAYFVFVWTLGT